MSNHLAASQSPYLLQHQDNPVNWHEWGDEAFARARAEDKPIFLSIGYSTCHWCHVMAHESFEDPRVANVLNEHFISIKVDREERPDVDRVYMTFVQVTTGSGGWPMSVWLTPSLEPFYGGTYFPPASKWGRPGFVDILQEIARAWREDRGRVESSAGAIVERLRSLGADGSSSEVPSVATLDAAVRQFEGAFDARRGGFGDAPKFPRPSELLFLLREHARTGSSAALDMALTTLRAMALGGMRDHLGGGFHRYSVDGNWRVPHFEKMLYDQAQLVLAYLEAAQASGDRFFADVAADTLAYVARDLADEHGGFYSAEDADSVPPEEAGVAGAHKMEGAFYIWRDAEVIEALGADADVFRVRFGVLPDGNAPFDPQQEFVGKNLLYTARGLDEVVSATAKPRPEIEAALGRARTVLLDRRSTRPRPHLDDKVLTAWNGLMIAAFARAARVLGGPDKARPTHDEDARPPHDEDARPPHDEEARPPHDEEARPPHDEEARPPHDEEARPPHDEEARPPHDEEARPPHDEEARPPHDEEARPPHDEEARPPHDEEARPTHDEEARPTHDEEARPPHDEDARPTHDEEARPTVGNQPEGGAHNGGAHNNVEADLQVGLATDQCLAAARRAALFIWKHLWNADTKTLLRRYRRGDAAVEGYAEDYAYLVFGLLELFQADGDAIWLEWALTLQRRQDELFSDPVEGGWFSTTGRDPSVLLRLKEDYDGAEPAASSVTALNLLTLSHLTNDAAFEQAIERTLGLFAPRMAQNPRTVPMMLCALSTRQAGVSQVVIAGDRAAEGTRALMDVVRRRYMPFAITVPLSNPNPESRIPNPGTHSLAALLPWTAAMAQSKASVAYVCRDFVCLSPATSAEELTSQLAAEAS